MTVKNSNSIIFAVLKLALITIIALTVLLVRLAKNQIGEQK